MRVTLILLFVFFVSSYAISQKHDYNWIVGGTCGLVKDRTVLEKLDFNKNLAKIITIDNTIISLFITNISISDEYGNLQFYSNGSSIVNWQHEIMENGGDLLGREDCLGTGIPQGILCLPYPNKANQYVLLYSDGEFNVGVTSIFYSIIDMGLNDGEGRVIVKDELLIDDILAHASLTAIKSGDGINWWILVNKDTSKSYYRVLLDDNGLGPIQLIESEVEVQSGFSQASYSPDGTKFAIISNLSSITGGEFYLWDVNRCDGLLENGQTFSFGPQPSSAIGIAFSSNSRFLYTALRDSLYQYDLYAPSIKESKIYISNSFGVDEDEEPFVSTFSTMQLAPDGKIYITNSIDNSYMHVINNPNEKGALCDFELRGMEWSSNVNFSIPNNPNYRLGPLDGSACDTLGIDNNPVANFNYEESNSFTYSFRDLSYYEPSQWLWDFGDGVTSVEQNPSHEFLENGDYRVCLSVSNANSSHTYCEDICVHPLPNFVAYIDAEYNILDCKSETRKLDLVATINGDSVSNFPNLIIDWTGPNGFENNALQIEISEGGTYILSIIDTEIGCETKDSIFIYENYYPPSFTYILTEDAIPCEGSLEIVLDVDASCHTTIWRNEQAEILFGSGTNLSVSEAGVYTVTVINCETNCATSALIEVKDELITAAWTSEEMGGTFSFFSNQTSDVDHQWNFGDGGTSEDQDPEYVYTSTGTYQITHIVSNACGADTLQQSVNVIISSSTSLAEGSIQIFPNPTNDDLNIQSTVGGISQVKLYTSLGQVQVAERVQSSEIEVSVRDYVAGVYWLQVLLVDGRSWTERVVVLGRE